MRSLFQLLSAAAVLSAVIGCETIANNIANNAEDSIRSAAGESSQERADRHQLEQYREFWPTPGRTAGEIDGEARETFRKTYGRDAPR